MPFGHFLFDVASNVFKFWLLFPVNIISPSNKPGTLSKIYKFIKINNKLINKRLVSIDDAFLPSIGLLLLYTGAVFIFIIKALKKIVTNKNNLMLFHNFSESKFLKRTWQV